MSNYTNTLPAIVSVEYCQATQAVFTPDKHLSPGEVISVSGSFTELDLVGLASCTTTNERTDAGIVFTTKISCLLPDDPSQAIALNTLQEKFHVYRIKDVYGNYSLIGANVAPYPEANFNPQNDSNPSGIRAVNMEISWISTLPPVPLI